MIKPALILAVDPGKSGAMAFLDYATGSLVEVCDMPCVQGVANKAKTDKGVKPTVKKQLDLYLLAQTIDRHAQNIRYAVIEDVHSMPHDGTVSAFSFGKTHGIVIGVVASYMIPMYFIKAAVWKRAMGLSYEKAKSIDLAREIFKPSAHYFTMRKHDGRAEACLLAHFGRRFWL